MLPDGNFILSMSSCTGSRGKHCQCILPCLNYQNNARHCILSFQVNICVSRTSTVLERKVYPVRSSWEGHYSSCKRLPVEKATVSDTLNYARLNDGATYTGPVRSRCRRHHDCSGSEEDDGLEKVHFKIRWWMRWNSAPVKQIRLLVRFMYLAPCRSLTRWKKIHIKALRAPTA